MSQETAVRTPDVLTADRVRAYGRVLATVLAVVCLLRAAGFGHGDVGGDYLSFWTASDFVLHGHAADAYVTSINHAAQKSLVGRDDIGWAAFFYPPIYLLICAPLALLPFGWSFAVWLAGTIGAFVAVVRRLLPRQAGWLPFLAFPAAWINAMFLQNGFLSAALFGGAALTLERRPVLAGLCFGCLSYKPQMCVVIPFALLAARRWTALFVAAGTVAVLAGVSVAAFGMAPWHGFLGQLSLARMGMEQGEVGFWKLVSLFSTLRLLGVPVAGAYVGQAALTAAVIAALVLELRHRPGGTAEGAAICACAAMCTLFLLVYDLVILAVPLAWMLSRGLASGFLAGERAVLIVGFLLVAILIPPAAGLHAQVAPFGMMAVAWGVFRRCRIAA